MTKSTELIKELGTKLDTDLKSSGEKGPDGDLYYVMALRLEDAIRTAAFDKGYKDPESVMDMSNNATKAFLKGIIELSKTYA